MWHIFTRISKELYSAIWGLKCKAYFCDASRQQTKEILERRTSRFATLDIHLFRHFLSHRTGGSVHKIAYTKKHMHCIAQNGKNMYRADTEEQIRAQKAVDCCVCDAVFRRIKVARACVYYLRTKQNLVPNKQDHCRWALIGRLRRNSWYSGTPEHRVPTDWLVIKSTGGEKPQKTEYNKCARLSDLRFQLSSSTSRPFLSVYYRLKFISCRSVEICTQQRIQDIIPYPGNNPSDKISPVNRLSRQDPCWKYLL